MASPHVPRPLRVLVSEGNSTSAREAITILGLSGHHIEVCDPAPFCLVRFSRFVGKFHRCPGLRDDPAGFLGFVEGLLSTGHHDVLLPTHEQGFLFARVQERLTKHVGLALPGSHAVPERGATVRAAEREVGAITSAVQSPALGHAIALAYVHRDFTAPGTALTVDDKPATVTALPFV